MTKKTRVMTEHERALVTGGGDKVAGVLVRNEADVDREARKGTPLSVYRILAARRSPPDVADMQRRIEAEETRRNEIGRIKIRLNECRAYLEAHPDAVPVIEEVDELEAALRELESGDDVFYTVRKV